MPSLENLILILSDQKKVNSVLEMNGLWENPRFHRKLSNHFEFYRPLSASDGAQNDHEKNRH